MLGLGFYAEFISMEVRSWSFLWFTTRGWGPKRDLAGFLQQPQLDEHIELSDNLSLRDLNCRQSRPRHRSQHGPWPTLGQLQRADLTAGQKAFGGARGGQALAPRAQVETHHLDGVASSKQHEQQTDDGYPCRKD
jgi:hypothetical protein